MMNQMRKMNTKYNFDFQIETRSSKEGDRPRYIVKGYATVPNHLYAHRYFKNGVSLKEMFTQKGVDNLIKKLKSKNVFVDALHEQGTLYNTTQLLKAIQDKTGVNISSEANEIITQVKHSDIPLAKFNSVSLDGDKPYIETELNPLYREVDEKHKAYFDAVWYSLQNGYLNKFSINFRPTDTESTVIDGEIVPKINDIDIFGVSYTQGAANEMSDITEVAMRSAMESEEVKRMEEEKFRQIERENQELKNRLEESNKKDRERVESERKAKEELEKKKIEDTKGEIERQKAELARQQEQIKKEMEELSKNRDSMKSIAPSEDRFRKSSSTPAQEVISKVLEAMPEVNVPKSGRMIDRYGFYKSIATRPNSNNKVGIGELILAQAKTDGTSLYPDDTRAYLGGDGDISVGKIRR